MAEDQAVGTDAQFTVNVDGQQIGGLQTVTASQSAGQTEPFTFEGNFAPGQHTITVTFANNFIYPGESGDRNLYVDGVTYDGQTVSSTTTPVYQSPLFPPNSTTGNNYGNAAFTVNDTTSVPAGAPSTPTTTPAAVSVGSGSDTLVLNMAEDPYQGDAQFTVSVDGQQVGGTLTTTAVVSQGQTQEFDIHGNFGSGTHSVSVDYVNDYVGGYYPPGTPGVPAGGALDTEDRNLYVMGASLDGGPAASGTPWELSSDGAQTFSVTAGSNPSATDASSGLFGSDGAPVTSDNVAISSSSLSAGSSTSGSSSGISFIATPTTSGSTTSGSGTSDTSGSGGSGSTSSSDSSTSGSGSTTTGSTDTTTDPSSTVASVVGATSQTSQDFSVPSASGSSSSDSSNGGSDPTSGTSGGSAWWMTHDTGHVAAAHQGS